MSDLPKTSWWRRLGILGGKALIVILVLAFAVAAADRSGLALDWSADRRFSIAPRLAALARAQQEPVELVAIWSQGEQQGLGLDDCRTQLEAVSRLAPTLSFRRIDPELHKPLLAQFAEKHGEASSPAVYATRGGRSFKVPLGPSWRLMLQRELGGALAALADPDPPRIYVMRGHGELRPGGGAEDGCSLLGRALELGGFRVLSADAGTASIPPDAVLMLAGPTAALGQQALGLLDQHLRDGGGLLLLADDRAPPDLSTWMRRHGILAAGGFPADERVGADRIFAADLPSAPARHLVSLRHHAVGRETGFPHHNLLLDGEGFINPGAELGAALARSGRQLLSPFTSPVEVLPVGRDADLQRAWMGLGLPPFAALPLMQTAPADAWAKRRGDPLQEPQGLERADPRGIAWQIECLPARDSVRAGVGARILVWGSRQAASDGVLAQGRFANDEALVGAARWLARRGAPADIPQAAVAVYQVRASEGALTVIMAILVALVPCLCLGGAMISWWERR